MGDGTASGVQTPPQEGVIVKEGENFPIIPKRLLRLSPDELQNRIDRVVRALELNSNSFFYSARREEELLNAQSVFEFAKTAVERQRLSVERL
jgi:hypothetical protein